MLLFAYLNLVLNGDVIWATFNKSNICLSKYYFKHFLHLQPQAPQLALPLAQLLAQQQVCNSSLVSIMSCFSFVLVCRSNHWLSYMSQIKHPWKNVQKNKVKKITKSRSICMLKLDIKNIKCNWAHYSPS